MKITTYQLTSKKIVAPLRAAVVADLHDRSYQKLLSLLQNLQPDCIFIPGDLTESLEDAYDEKMLRQGIVFLEKILNIAPVFYAFGNHESGACHRNLRHARTLDREKRGRVHPSWKKFIQNMGVTLLDENFVEWRGLKIGGMGSGLLNPGRVPDYDWVRQFAEEDGYKILLCHHPEYFDRYLRDLAIDLFVSGHAHGGQWRMFGRGVYAPDQPLFPPYTSGMHEGRLVISRGVTNTVAPIPRLFNPCELVMLELGN